MTKQLVTVKKQNKDHAAELEDIDDLNSDVDDTWAERVRSGEFNKPAVKKSCCGGRVAHLKAKGGGGRGRGNIAGLAKHLAKKYGPADKGYFTRCMAAEEVANYPEESRKAICARAHKEAIGIWPAESPEAKKKKEVKVKAKMPIIVIDSEENDDWMKSLPGYKNEVELHEQLAAKLKNKGKS